MQETEATIITSRLSESASVALWRSLSISSLIELSFQYKYPSVQHMPQADSNRSMTQNIQPHFRKELFELTAKLSRKSFVVCKHKCRSLNPLNNICHCKSFTRTRYTEECLFTVACIYTVYKLFDCLRLVACRLIF